MNEFNKIKDFYPTPPELIGKMFDQVDINKIKYILEPSAGKGDIVEFCQAYYDAMQNGYAIRRLYKEYDGDDFDQVVRCKVIEEAVDK